MLVSHHKIGNFGKIRENSINAPVYKDMSKQKPHACIWKDVAIASLGAILATIISLLIIIATQHK